MPLHPNVRLQSNSFCGSKGWFAVAPIAKGEKIYWMDETEIPVIPLAREQLMIDGPDGELLRRFSYMVALDRYDSSTDPNDVSFYVNHSVRWAAQVTTVT